MDKKRIAIINQRYGLEVNGGSEYYTRLIAGMLHKNYDVEVLTTTALNYDTWKNYYPEGIQELDGIRVRRFSVNYKRNRIIFGKFNSLIKHIRYPFMEEIWIRLQGPVSKRLIRYIKKHKNDYDLFIFVTYLYYPTVKGLPLVADKAILIPTAHDEECIYFDIFKEIFRLPKGIIYLTEEEHTFVTKTFDTDLILHDVIGIGVDIPGSISVKSFREKYNIHSKYIIYAGRIDPEKGCNIMIEYFINYKNIHPDNEVILVLIGNNMMNIPVRPDIIFLGYVSEEDKFNGISDARALILPSKYESLSISVLEAMALKTPILVNGDCEVLKGHCEKSGGGFCFYSYTEFEQAFEILTSDHCLEYNQLQNNAKKYIENNYTWEVCNKKFITFIEKC